MKWYFKVLKNYADFSGRARRKEYWSFTLFHIVISMVIMSMSLGLAFTLVDVSGETEITGAGSVLGVWGLYMVYSLLTLIPSLAVSVRRLHDVGKSGWMLLVSLIPVVGSIWLLILLLTDSQPGDNEYGANPKY